MMISNVTIGTDVRSQSCHYRSQQTFNSVSKLNLHLGMFASEDDVLRHAMDTPEKRQAALARGKEMIELANENVVAGRVAAFNADQTKELVRQRLAKAGVVESCS